MSYFNSGVPSVPYQDLKLGGLENRFQNNRRFKNGGVLRPRVESRSEPLLLVFFSSLHPMCCVTVIKIPQVMVIL
jgi:hypothetical protein